MSEPIAEFLQICQSAQEHSKGRLVMTGITDRFDPRQYPCRIVDVAIVLRLRIPVVTRFAGRIRRVIIGPNDQIIHEDVGDFDLIRQPQADDLTSCINMIQRYKNFLFEAPGTYELAAYWNGKQIASTPFFLIYGEPKTEDSE